MKVLSNKTRSTMCYKGKCLICIPVEHGCLVLAILSAIGTGLVLLATVFSVAVIGVRMIYDTITAHYPHYHSLYLRHGYLPEDRIAMVIVIPVIGVASLVAFIFSVLLCNGICKRRPGQVKAYFVYGVNITVLTVLSAVGYLSIHYREPEPGIMMLLACVIYSLFLVLVHQTHAKLQDGAMFKDHIRLVES